MSVLWPKVRLGEVLTPVSRPEKADTGTIYRMLGTRWYAGGLFIKNTCDGAELRAHKVYRVERGDFVYNRLFAWKGSFALADDATHGCYVSNEFPCFQLNAKRIEPRYLQRYMSRESAWTEALGLSSGGTPTSRNRLKEEKLLGMEIPLPTLAEQNRIVARIEEVAVKLTEARNLRKEAQNDEEAFVVSAHLKLAGERKKRLRQVLKLEEDKERVVASGSYPQVGMNSFGGGLFSKPAVGGMETTYKTFNRLYPGALVLSQVKGWEGAVAICPDNLAGSFVSPEYRTFRCIPDEARPAYLSPLVRTEWFWRKLLSATRGVGARRERTRPEQFLDIEVSMPEVGRQILGEKLFKELDALKRLQAETAAELDALLPSVIDRAFKGQL